MIRASFDKLAGDIVETIGDAARDARLERVLNDAYPVGGDVFERLAKIRGEATAGGWMRARRAGAIRYGRLIKPGGIARNFSVDVVLMDSCIGPSGPTAPSSSVEREHHGLSARL